MKKGVYAHSDDIVRMKPRKNRQLAPEERRILIKKAKKRHGFCYFIAIV